MSRPRLALAIVFILSATGCRKLATIALDHETDGGFSQATGGGGSAKGGAKACDLLTNAEVEAASGKKVTKRDGGDDQCSWELSGGPGGASGANVSLQIISEAAIKMIPSFGQQTAVPGVGNSATWTGGMAPNLRVHVKNGMVINFLFVDPQLMMKNPGITEKKVDKNNSLVNMEYPELEKEAVTLGKAAAARY